MDDDSCTYEPLETEPQLQPPAQSAAQPEQQQQQQPFGATLTLPEQLAELAGHLSYHSMSDADAWRELRLMQRIVGCLAAAARHARATELAGAAQPLLRLATDRMVAVPVELDAGLPALLDALGARANGSSGSATLDAAVASAAAELALSAAVSLAAQLSSPSARRRLWQEVHQRLLPLATQQLEQQQVALAQQARAAGSAAAVQPTPQQLYSVMMPCQLVYFYVLQAPAGTAAAPAGGGASRLQEALLRGGLLRALVLLFVQLAGQPGSEPLRCALLLACAAAPPLVDWAAQVSGFKAAATAPALQPGGEAPLHGALWQVLLGGGGSALVVLLEDATPAAKVRARQCSARGALGGYTGGMAVQPSRE